MKILVVSEDDEVSKRITGAAKKASCDVIRYRYPIKAMDNVVEIDPDVIVINAVDFPLHWQTLAAYTLCVGLNPTMALCVPPDFSGEDADIAQCLGITLTGE